MVAEIQGVKQYRVMVPNLCLNGIGNPPDSFWAVQKGQDGRVLIEPAEDEGYWVYASELEKAVERGWIQPVED